MLLKLLIAAVILLSVLFLALLWLVSVLAKISLLVPGLVTLAAVLVVVAFFITRRWNARKAARGLEQGLRDQAKAQQGHVRPDLELELHQMQESFDRAVTALKNSPHGRRSGADALYFLPWYAMIGPSGAGKTTALRHSGLKFPPMKGARDVKVRGLGGTRNCDWWLTNQAVLLDTAGRWATDEDDHDEWLSFLGLLKRYRPRKPLNGVIAAISVGDIVNASEDEVLSLAIQMRERVDEIIGQLRVALPVYVLFTKCDLVEGFVETFSELPAAEREQVWGFTAPLATGATHDAGAYFDEQFGELTTRLESVSLARIGVARRTAARQMIYAFPQQVMAMRHNLASFLGAMFETSVYHETPALRGVYFTSGTQEGRPFSLLMRRLAEAVGAQDRLPDNDELVDQKSYFLRDLFLKVIFEDQDLASASQKELRRRRIRQAALTAGLGAIAIALGVVPSFAYRQGRAQLLDTAALLEAWERPSVAAQSPQQRLADVGKLLHNLDGYDADAPTFLSTLGMYEGDRVRPQLRHFSAALLRREFVQPVVAADVQSLTEFGFKYEAAPKAVPASREQSTSYDQVKLHLLVSAPKAPDEPSLDRGYAAWVAAQLTHSWQAAGVAPEGRPEALDALAKRFVQYLHEYPELNFVRDANVLRRARAALTRVSPARQSLERIIAQVADQGYDLTLAKLIGPVQGVSAERNVRGAFTRRGWEGVVRDALNVDALQHAGELWVLGLADRRDSKRQTDVQIAELTTLYFQTYVDEWRSFLHSVRVVHPSTHAEALALLNELLQGQPTPLLLLLQRVNYNVQLKPKPTEAVATSAVAGLKERVGHLLGVGGDDDDARKNAIQTVRSALTEDDTQRMTAARVATAFQGFTGFGVASGATEDGPPASTSFASYEAELGRARDALQAYGEGAMTSDQLLSALRSAQMKVRNLVDAREPAWRGVFAAILEPPIESAAASSTRTFADTTARRWCSEVVEPFERVMHPKYPFERRGLDLPLEAFSEFYKPSSGTLWRFAHEALGGVVELDGDTFTFAHGPGRNPGGVYSASLPQYLTRSRELSAAFFPKGSEQPKFDFEVRVHPAPGVATTTLMVGGKTIEYHNGPEHWTPLSWPGADPDAGAAFMARGANGMQERARQEGTWGLFRLLEAGTVTRPSSQVFTVAWQLRTHDVTLRVDFRALRSESPFFGETARGGEPQLLEMFRAAAARVPTQIVQAGPSCRN